MGALLNEENQGLARQSLGGLPHVVDTFPVLRLLAVTDLFGLAVVGGAAVVGDGSGGTFYWAAASTATDNNSTVIKPVVVGTGPGRWLLLIQQSGGGGGGSSGAIVNVSANYVALSTDNYLRINPTGNWAVTLPAANALGPTLSQELNIKNIGTTAIYLPTVSAAPGDTLEVPITLYPLDCYTLRSDGVSMWDVIGFYRP